MVNSVRIREDQIKLKIEIEVTTIFDSTASKQATNLLRAVQNHVVVYISNN